MCFISASRAVLLHRTIVRYLCRAPELRRACRQHIPIKVISSPSVFADSEHLVRFIVLGYRLAYDAFLAFARDDGWAIASHIALSTLMSLFPFLIFVTALTSYVYGSEEIAEKAAQ